MEQNNNLSFLHMNWLLNRSMGLSNRCPPDFNVFTALYYNLLSGSQALLFPCQASPVKCEDQFSQVKVQEMSTHPQKDEIQIATPGRVLPSGTQKKMKVPEIETDVENKSSNSTGKSRGFFRNAILSFIFNRILKFIRNSEQSKAFVANIFEHNGGLSKKAMASYYKYAHEASKKVINAVSIQKIRELWTGPQRCCGEERKFYHYIFRCLSRIYLERMLPSVLYETKKLTPQQRSGYLRMRQCLLFNLEQPADFKSYQEF